MESRMLKKLKSLNPDNDYPCNLGQKWSAEEDNILLEELNTMDIETISQAHNRSVGGINARRREIAYKMYLQNVAMEEIIRQTKLEHDYIRKTIERREHKPNVENIGTENIDIKEIQVSVNEMKNDIKEMKNTINELVELIKSIYEFENII